jgi:hypothetical protein
MSDEAIPPAYLRACAAAAAVAAKAVAGRRDALFTLFMLEIMAGRVKRRCGAKGRERRAKSGLSG